MSDKRDKRYQKKAGAALSASLVSDDDGSSGAPSDAAAVAGSPPPVRTPRTPAPASNTSPEAAAAASGSGALSPHHPRVFGAHTSSSASYNAPLNSSLSGGGKDLELVDLKGSSGGGGSGGGRGRDFSDDHHDAGDVHVQLPGDDEDDPSHRRNSISGTAILPSSGSPRMWPSVLRDGWRVYAMRSLKELLFSSKLNILLLAIPIAIIARAAEWSDAVIFFFSLVALCPLAERIAFVTDEMAKYTNDTLGGLLSATMGNVTELIVSVVALNAGLIRVVQLSLLGSIYSNLLLVQGMAFLVGGLKYKQQSYSQAAAKTNVSLLLLAVLALTLPMVLIASNSSAVSGATLVDGQGATVLTNGTALITDPSTEGITEHNALILSRLAAVLLLIVYALLVLYQLKTHVHLFEARDHEQDGPVSPASAATGGMADHAAATSSAEDDDVAESDADEPPVLGFWGAIAWAVVITVIISVLSEFIVGAIEGAASTLGFPVLFIATILLPIVGNAAEHASALIFAKANKMDIALGISVGSSTQIALFVVPLMVVLGWMMGQPLSLDFMPFETVSLLLTVVMTSIILSTGKSDWLYGTMMIVAYVIIAAAFWLQMQPAALD